MATFKGMKAGRGSVDCYLGITRFLNQNTDLFGYILSSQRCPSLFWVIFWKIFLHGIHIITYLSGQIYSGGFWRDGEEGGGGGEWLVSIILNCHHCLPEIVCLKLWPIKVSQRILSYPVIWRAYFWMNLKTHSFWSHLVHWIAHTVIFIFLQMWKDILGFEHVLHDRLYKAYPLLL